MDNPPEKPWEKARQKWEFLVAFTNYIMLNPVVGTFTSWMQRAVFSLLKSASLVRRMSLPVVRRAENER